MGIKKTRHLQAVLYFKHQFKGYCVNESNKIKRSIVREGYVTLCFFEKVRKQFTVVHPQPSSCLPSSFEVAALDTDTSPRYFRSQLNVVLEPTAPHTHSPSDITRTL